ncbi:MAG: zinc ribbon domain-containing protein [Candidatus Saccharimonadales bacterium]
MDCPKCGEPVQADTEFCGSCGQALAVPAAPLAPTAVAPPLATPTPALAPVSHPTKNKAVAGLMLSTLAIPASILPILGLVLGISGLVLGTISRQYGKKVLSLLAIIFGGIAIALSLGVWVHAANQYDQSRQSKQSAALSSAISNAYAKIPI